MKDAEGGEGGDARDGEVADDGILDCARLFDSISIIRIISLSCCSARATVLRFIFTRRGITTIGFAIVDFAVVATVAAGSCVVYCGNTGGCMFDPILGGFETLLLCLGRISRTKPKLHLLICTAVTL
jgi:hypothetical protein